MRGRPIFYAQLTFVLLLAGPVAAEVTVPDPGRYVVDQAGVIAPDIERQMEGWLAELEQKTTAQLKVLTVPTTGGEDIFGFAMRHAELWKLGKADKDNGVLVVLAVQDRKDQIVVGYGLEGLLPDSWCGSLRRKVMIPQFKQGQFSQGLYQAVVAIANRIADEAGVTLTGMPTIRHQSQGGGKSGARYGGCCFPLFIMMMVLSSFSRRRRSGRTWAGGGLWEALFWGSMLNNMGRGRSSWGGGSGGGFGGGFGGGGSFGGGGGFGGGGAGGGW